MIGLRGLTLALVFWLCWAHASSAQMVGDPLQNGPNPYADYIDQIEPNGGFGLDTMQAPVAGAFWLDRFGLLQGPVPVEQAPMQPIPTVATRRARTKPASAQPSPGVAPRRARTKPANRAASRRVSQPAYSLPTGSLAWPAARDVVLYSPELRYQSYGGGYGRGPYGALDCGMMYKGMQLGY
jgi:hypothetical protein